MIDTDAVHPQKCLSNPVQFFTAGVSDHLPDSAGTVVVYNAAIFGHSTGQSVAPAAIAYFCQASAGDQNRPVTVSEHGAKGDGAAAGQSRKPKRFGFEDTVQVEAADGSAGGNRHVV